MKTTIDIPETLYKRAKIRAIERGQTLKQVVLAALERELNADTGATAEEPPSYWANRQLLPEYVAAAEAGAFKPKPGERDITELISEDRDGR